MVQMIDNYRGLPLLCLALTFLSKAVKESSEKQALFFLQQLGLPGLLAKSCASQQSRSQLQL